MCQPFAQRFYDPIDHRVFGMGPAWPCSARQSHIVTVVGVPRRRTTSTVVAYRHRSRDANRLLRPNAKKHAAGAMGWFAPVQSAAHAGFPPKSDGCAPAWVGLTGCCGTCDPSQTGSSKVLDNLPHYSDVRSSGDGSQSAVARRAATRRFIVVVQNRDYECVKYPPERQFVTFGA